MTAHVASDVLVIELGHDRAVEFTGRLMALSGIRVIKVESVADGTASRTGGQSFRAADRAEPAGSLFHYLNQGKQSVAVDLSQPGGNGLAGKLIGRADAVLVDGAMACAPPWADVISQHRRGVEIRISPFGMTGPRSREPAAPITVFASAGEGSILPGGAGYALHPDGPPLLGRGHLVDFDTGVIAATCATAALASDDPPGIIDISKQEAEASLNRWLVSHFAASGWVESRATRAYGFGGLMQCLDGFVMLQPTTDAHWAGLKTMMGNPDWADSPELATQERRINAGSEVQSRLTAWATDRRVDEIFAAALANDVPAAPFRSIAQVAECPQYAARGFLAPYGGTGALPALPFRAHPGVRSHRSSAPDLGQDTEVVFGEYEPVR